MNRRNFIKGLAALGAALAVPFKAKAEEIPCDLCGCVGTKGIGDKDWKLNRFCQGAWLCPTCEANVKRHEELHEETQRHFEVERLIVEHLRQPRELTPPIANRFLAMDREYLARLDKTIGDLQRPPVTLGDLDLKLPEGVRIVSSYRKGNQ